MEEENAKMRRQLKYLEEMTLENEEVEAEHQKKMAAKQPFSGQGFKLGAPAPVSAPVNTSQAPIKKVNSVIVYQNKPSGNIQVHFGF